jgi:pSer/pThr/pTyr-binding forkhead associated (FHA) protein
VTEQLLLVLRIGFVVVLYLFIWRIVRLGVRDLRAPQESMVIGAAAARAAGLGTAAPALPSQGVGGYRLVVQSSPLYPPGTVIRLDDDVLFGRAPECDVPLEGDAYASSRHAQVIVREGVRYLRDLGSRNGTHVGGHLITAEHRLRPGDDLRIGETELRYEE